MAKYIVNIILVTACLFTYTSCIRKMNLYDENRNTGQDNNEKDTDSTPVYMYPFDKETANVTAEIIIHTKKEIQTKDISVISFRKQKEKHSTSIVMEMKI